MSDSKINDGKELLTAKELAQRWKISPRSIYNAVSNGSFPVKPIRIGRRLLRWRRNEIEKYIASL